MNNTFSLQQISQTGNLGRNLVTRQFKFNLMAQFMEHKSNNPTLKQSEMAKKLSVSSSTLQKYRKDISMFSPYRIPAKSNKRKQKISNREHDFGRLQMTSSDVKRPRML